MMMVPSSDDGSKQPCTSTELDSSVSIQVDAGVSSKLYSMHPPYSGALENISTHKVERHVGFSVLQVGKTIRFLLVLFVVLFSLLINAIGQVPVPKPNHYKIVWRWVPSYSNSLGGRPCLLTYNSYSNFSLHGVWGYLQQMLKSRVLYSLTMIQGIRSQLYLDPNTWNIGLPWTEKKIPCGYMSGIPTAIVYFQRRMHT